MIDKACIIHQGADHLLRQMGCHQYHAARVTIVMLRKAIDEAAGHLANL